MFLEFIESFPNLIYLLNNINAINAQVHGTLMCGARATDGSSLEERVRNTIRMLEEVNEEDEYRRHKGEIENLEIESLRRKLLSDLDIAFSAWRQMKPAIMKYLEEADGSKLNRRNNRVRVDGHVVEFLDTGKFYDVYVELKTRLEPTTDIAHVDDMYLLSGLFISDMYYREGKLEMKTDHLWQLALATMLVPKPKTKILRIGVTKEGMALTYFLSAKAPKPMATICDKHDRSPECKMKLMKWLINNLSGNDEKLNFMAGYFLGDGTRVLKKKRICVDLSDNSAPQWWLLSLKRKLEEYGVKVYYVSSRNMLRICDNDTDNSNNPSFLTNLANKMRTLPIPVPSEKLPQLSQAEEEPKRSRKKQEKSKRKKQKKERKGSASIYLIKYPIIVSIGNYGLILKVRSTNLKNIEDALSELEKHGITKDDISIGTAKCDSGRRVEYYIYIKSSAIPRLLCGCEHLLVTLHEELRQKVLEYLRRRCPKDWAQAK